MNRTLFVGFLMLAVVSTVLHGCKREEVAPKPPEAMVTKDREEDVLKGIEMRLTPSKKEYRLDEDIVMEVSFVNRGDKPCWIVSVPEAVMQVLELSRDGTTLAPDPTMRLHYLEFEDYIRTNLIQLQTQGSHSFQWDAARWTSMGSGVVFSAVPTSSPNTKVVWHWAIDKPGVYTLTARAQLALSVHLPPDICRIGDNSRTATFSVRQ